MEGLETSPTDRKVLELLADAEWLSAPRAYRALELLRGHPRLFDHFQNPVTVVEAELRVELQRAGEGYVLRTFFGDCELRPDWIAACCEGSRYFVDLDDDATCRISELSQVGHALIMTLAMTGDFVPAHAMDELLRRLPELQQHVDIVLPPEVLGRRVAASTGLVAQISWLSSEDVVLSLRSRPVPGGPSLEPGRGVSRIVSGSRGRRVHALRDLVRERELARELLSAPGLRDAVATGRFERRVSGREELVRMLGALRERSQDVRVEWLGDPLEMLAPIPRRALRFQITGKGGLLDLDGHVDLGGERVALAALLDAARSGREWVQLSPRRFAQLEEDLRSTLSGLAELTQSQTKAEVSPALAPMLDELIEGLEVADRSALTSALARQKAAAAHTAELPATLKAVLRPYQAEGFQWLSRLATWGVGACLADDMGLGKTLQCLALLLTRSHTGPALIVAPTSVADNWRNEAARFAPELDVRIYRGQHRKRALDGLAKGSILIASYDLAARDVDALAKLQFATLVLDEAQAVKNSHTQRTKAIRKLNAEFRVALTGTPLENHVGELWSIFRILEPGLLGTWDWFSQRFAQPIEIEGDQRRLEALRRLLRPFILRRTKQQVLPELPERVEVVQQVELSPGERTLYHTAHLAALARAREGGSDARMEVLAAITRLRRLVCHPALYDKTSTLESSKLHALLGLMEELREEGRRALVFSQFTSFLELARAKLEAAGFSLQQLDGSTPATDRAKRVEAFQDGEGDAFLISLKAGGTGLNLTAADTVILLDPWWNPAVEDQAADRAHRFGQKRSVTIVRLVASNTIEDKVIAMHRDKRDLAERLLSGTDVGSKLTSEALLELLEDAAAVDVTPSRKAPKQKRPRRSSQATSPRDS